MAMYYDRQMVLTSREREHLIASFCGVNVPITKYIVFPICRGASGFKLIEIISCSTQLSMNFFLPINVKMPIIIGILTLISWKNSILCFSEPKRC